MENTKKATATRTTKKDIYLSFGIPYDPKTGKIYNPDLDLWIRPLLVKGNKKIGVDCWHFSTLPGTEKTTIIINDTEYTIGATCPCDCVGCYAKSGNYLRYPSTKYYLAIRTYIARKQLQFFENAVKAQLIADKIKKVRIHASGDFFSADYLRAWKRIIKEFSNITFWTYTKNTLFENAFDEFDNANIVKSIIKNHGLNFGHCDYILETYNALKKAGKSVYICRCGIDKNQHCSNCTACALYEYVLFIEHSTEYKAEKDPLFETLKAIIESQERI